MPDVGDCDRIGNPATNPATGAPLASAPSAFVTDGEATDPSTVTLRVRRPDGSVLEYGWPLAGPDGILVQEATGRFYADITYDQSGQWRYRLEGTGDVVAAEEGWVTVNQSWVPAS